MASYPDTIHMSTSGSDSGTGSQPKPAPLPAPKPVEGVPLEKGEPTSRPK